MARPCVTTWHLLRVNSDPYALTRTTRPGSLGDPCREVPSPDIPLIPTWGRTFGTCRLMSPLFWMSQTYRLNLYRITVPNCRRGRGLWIGFVLGFQFLSGYRIVLFYFEERYFTPFTTELSLLFLRRPIYSRYMGFDRLPKSKRSFRFRNFTEGPERYWTQGYDTEVGDNKRTKWGVANTTGGVTRRLYG